MLMDSTGHEVRKGRVGIDYFCSILSGPSAGKTQMTGEYFKHHFCYIWTRQLQTFQDLKVLPLYLTSEWEEQQRISGHVLKLLHPFLPSLYMHPSQRGLKLYLLSWGRGGESEREKGCPPLQLQRTCPQQEDRSGWRRIKDLILNKFRVLIIIKSRTF